MRLLNIAFSVLGLIICLYSQELCIACDGSEKKEDYSKLPLQISHPFNPSDFQRLKGEAAFEEDALKYLKQLEALSKHRSSIESLFSDPEFLKARDQMANCFFKILSYAAYLPNAGVLTKVLWRATHANSLESVITQPIVKCTVDGIYGQRPILRDIVDHVFNQELVRDDFNREIRIGTNPFFSPLCDLLDCLYNRTDFKRMPILLESTRQTLEKRYIYYTYLKPLENVVNHVHKINNYKQPSNIQETAQASYAYILKESNSEIIDDDDDDDYDGEYDVFIDDDDLQTETEEPIKPEIEEYLSFTEKMAYHFKRLKDIINQNITYRYNLDDKSLPIQIPSHLVQLRKSIPWGALSALGSAAHIAGENRHQVDIQRMFIQAVPDLLSDFRTLSAHLTKLTSAEQAFFLGQPYGESQEEEPDYSNINLFTTWYLHFVGLDMIANHIKDVQHYRNSFDKPKVIFDGFYKHQIDEEERKLPLLQSKSRLFTLYYLFVEGELSKSFVKRLAGRIDDTWLHLFKTFKELRDVIMHSAQTEGQQEFEKRLNKISSENWEQIVESYLAIDSIIEVLGKSFDVLTWDKLKQLDWKPMLTPLSLDERIKLEELQDKLQHLSTFITIGKWKNPITLKTKRDQLLEKFQEALPQNNRGFFSLKSIESLSKKDPSAWEEVLPKKLRKTMKDPWKEIGSCSFELKTIQKELKEKSRMNKRKGSEMEKFTDNLSNLKWVLEQLKNLYNHNSSRFSSVPEARVAELYLILLRESANHVSFNLPNYFIFDSHNKATVDFSNACTYLSAAIPLLISDFGNHKAHLHRLTEITITEMHFQSMGNILSLSLRELIKRIDVILSFLRVKDMYKKALGYRDGQDNIMAKEIFKRIISLCENTYPDLDEHSKSLHNLGSILDKEESYDAAAECFQKAASLGMQPSQRNIWRMQIDQKISASPEQRFFAICDLHNYVFPFEREGFQFNFHLQAFENSRTMNIGGIHAQTIHNTGLLSSPVIWVEQENGLTNSGKIKTNILIVGKKKK